MSFYPLSPQTLLVLDQPRSYKKVQEIHTTWDNFCVISRGEFSYFRRLQSSTAVHSAKTIHLQIAPEQREAYKEHVAAKLYGLSKKKGVFMNEIASTYELSDEDKDKVCFYDILRVVKTNKKVYNPFPWRICTLRKL